MNQTEQRRSILKRGRFRWGMACTAVMGAFATIHAGSVSAQGLFDDLLVRVPPSANALMVIDCKAVFSSPIAIKQGWKNRHRAAYVKKPFLLPPECDRLVLASQMNPNNDFAEAWELGVMSLNEVLTMRSIAKAEGGYVDQIGGLSAVWTPSNAYFVAVDRKVLGVMHPAHRQAVARWAKYSKSNHKVAIVPYLKKAVGGGAGEHANCDGIGSGRCRSASQAAGRLARVSADTGQTRETEGMGRHHFRDSGRDLQSATA